MSPLVAKHLGWVLGLIRPNATPGAVKLSNRTVMHSLGIANGLVSSGVW